MKFFLFALLLFPIGLLHAQTKTVQTSDDLTLTRVNQSAEDDSIEVELTFNVKDLSSDHLLILLGPEEGSGQYAVFQYEVKNNNGKKALHEGDKAKELKNGKLVVRKRIPKEAGGKEVHVHVKGLDKSRKEKYKVSKKVTLIK